MTTTNPVVTIDTTTNPVVTIDTIPQGVAAELIEAGAAIATGHGMVGSSERRYATLMTEAFPGWHLLTEKDTSNEAKLIKAGPKAKLFEQLKAARHTNPSTVWARLRKYAAEATEGTEGEGTDGTEPAKREIRVRLREELAKLVKAIEKEEFPAEDLRTAKSLIELAIGKVTPAAPVEKAA
jgi:hypothetical protein